MSERPTPETDGLVRSLNYEMLASTETCYSEMRTLCRRLERERDEARERADTMFVKHAEILDQYRRERDAERALAEQRGGLYDTAIRQLKALERDLDRLEAQLDAEHALADRLAEAATKSSNVIGPPDKVEWSTDDELNDAWDCSQLALAAWKEARSERGATQTHPLL